MCSERSQKFTRTDAEKNQTVRTSESHREMRKQYVKLC